MQPVTKNVGDRRQLMGKTVGFPSTPYQKLFKQLLESQIEPSAFDRIMRQAVLHNPGMKPPTTAMKDAIAKMNISPSVGESLHDLLRNPPSPMMRAAREYVQTGNSAANLAISSIPTMGEVTP